jgi:hypothetical protein
MKLVRCRLCGRPLRSPRSRGRGIGPTCARREWQLDLFDARRNQSILDRVR